MSLTRKVIPALIPFTDNNINIINPNKSHGSHLLCLSCPRIVIKEKIPIANKLEIMIPGGPFHSKLSSKNFELLLKIDLLFQELN